MVWSLQYYRFHFLQRQNNLHKIVLMIMILSTFGHLSQYNPMMQPTNFICMPIFNWPVQVESSSKINQVSGFPFYPVSLIFVLYYTACVQRNKIVSPGVQLSPAAPAPLPLAVSGQSSSYQCYGQSSLSHQHTFTLPPDQRDLSLPAKHITMSVLLQWCREKVLL